MNSHLIKRQKCWSTAERNVCLVWHYPILVLVFVIIINNNNNNTDNNYDKSLLIKDGAY